MTKKNRRRPSWLPPFALGAGLAAAYFVALRPFLLRWGSEEQELERAYPGDELVPDPRWEYTHAITIDAPPERVWPWLVQWGYRRGGFYSYDLIDRLVGATGTHSAREILPEHQNLKVGDQVLIADEMGFTVHAVQPEQNLILRVNLNSDTGEAYEPGLARPERFMTMVWGWYLQPLGDGRTRLISRSRIDYSADVKSQLAFGELVKVGGAIMDRGMLNGIKQRAEGMLVQ